MKKPGRTGFEQQFLLSSISPTMSRGSNPRRFIVDRAREQENDPIDATHSRGVLGKQSFGRPSQERIASTGRCSERIRLSSGLNMVQCHVCTGGGGPSSHTQQVTYLGHRLKLNLTGLRPMDKVFGKKIIGRGACLWYFKKVGGKKTS